MGRTVLILAAALLATTPMTASAQQRHARDATTQDSTWSPGTYDFGGMPTSSYRPSAAGGTAQAAPGSVAQATAQAQAAAPKTVTSYCSMMAGQQYCGVVDPVSGAVGAMHESYGQPMGFTTKTVQ